MSLRRSRKSFWPEYLCSLFLISLIGAFYYQGKDLDRGITYFVLGLALVLIASAEVSRAVHRCKVTPSKIMIIDGLVKQSTRHIYIEAISDIDVRQNLLQRMLGYGKIRISSMSGEGSLEIKDVDSPEIRIKELERVIEKYKNR